MRVQRQVFGLGSIFAAECSKTRKQELAGDERCVGGHPCSSVAQMFGDAALNCLTSLM
jgi:hypothetical protein